MYPQEQWQVSDYVPPQINEKNLWLLGVANSVPTGQWSAWKSAGMKTFHYFSITKSTSMGPKITFVFFFFSNLFFHRSWLFYLFMTFLSFWWTTTYLLKSTSMEVDFGWGHDASVKKLESHLASFASFQDANFCTQTSHHPPVVGDRDKAHCFGLWTGWPRCFWPSLAP